jgi:DNA-binding transcriptional ArsR family regulator
MTPSSDRAPLAAPAPPRAPTPAADKVFPSADALKAMSHPIRLQLIGLLRGDGPATATRLAERLGLSSGLTSYHLRQLAGFGFVEDMPDQGNGRDRWWRAVHRSTWTSRPEHDPAEQAAYDAFYETVAHIHTRSLLAAVAERPELPAAWVTAGTLSDWQLRLTPDQAQSLQDRLFEVLEEYRRVDPPTADEAPADAELFIVQLHTFLRPRSPGDPPRATPAPGPDDPEKTAP